MSVQQGFMPLNGSPGCRNCRRNHLFQCKFLHLVFKTMPLRNRCRFECREGPQAAIFANLLGHDPCTIFIAKAKKWWYADLI